MATNLELKTNVQEDPSYLDVGPLVRAQNIIENWGSQKSYDVIADISRELFPGFRQEPTLYPSLLQMLRTSDAVLLNSDSTPLHHFETKRLIGRYTDELDKRLEELPAYPEGHVEQIVNTGAWAYFTFVKMQPLVDGNKRVGRMILKRVLKGGGFRDIIFNNPRWFGVPHPGLLEAYERTARTGNLAHMEKYLLTMLADNYPPNERGTEPIRKEIQAVYEKKQHEIASSQAPRGREAVWAEFAKI